jgi:predicted metalloendopeptidase
MRTELASPHMRNIDRPIRFNPTSLQFRKRGPMPIPRFSAALVLSFAVFAAFSQSIVAQTFPAQTARPDSVVATGSAPADEAKEPKLEHFDPNLVDKALDPCNDFYKYACNKWLTSNPIPPDQVYWSTGSGLELWNEHLLRETLEAASKNDPSRNAVQQKIGDYWTACMDEGGIEAAGLKPLRPELERIAALKSKREITLEIAHLHHMYPGAWQQDDNQTNSAFFGFTGQPDYDDASKVVAQIDQGGLSLPNRDYYLKTDEKSKEILTKYRAHIRKMLVLAGESEAQAAADAGVVIDLDTAMAQAQMDNVRRRDPKNINNKMTLAQVREITPSIDWAAYLQAVKAPASEHYIVTAPDFFRAEEKLIAAHPLDHWQAYLRWQVIHHAAPYLNKAMVDENFDFFAHTLAGLKNNNHAGDAASEPRTAISGTYSARPMSTAPSHPTAKLAPFRWCTQSRRPWVQIYRVSAGCLRPPGNKPSPS